jgi:hypothetical protein
MHDSSYQDQKLIVFKRTVLLAMATIDVVENGIRYKYGQYSVRASVSVRRGPDVQSTDLSG